MICLLFFHCSLFIFLNSGSGNPGDEIQLGRIGCHHAAEVTIDQSKAWFGIYKINASDDYELKKVRPGLRPCHDPVFDNDEDSVSGREVFIEGNPEAPLLLLGGLALQEGKLETSFINNPRCLYPGDYIRFNMNNKEYALMATGTVAFDTAGNRMVPYIKNYKVLLVENMYNHPVIQEIISFDQLYASEEVQPSVFYVGDIDRDGKPDLLYDLSTHYNVSNITLFLSSKATSGKLVKQVASWNTTGC